MVSTNSVILKWLNIIAFVFTVLVNSLAGSTTIIGGKNTAQISDNNPTLITPAGYVFSIWGVIYILLGIFVIFQALPSEKGKDYQKRLAGSLSWAVFLTFCGSFYGSMSFSVSLLLLCSYFSQC